MPDFFTQLLPNNPFIARSTTSDKNMFNCFSDNKTIHYYLDPFLFDGNGQTNAGDSHES